MAKDDEELPLIVDLKSAIRGAGMSYSELARQSGVAHSQISRFMSGKTITAITAARLLEHFGLRVTPSNTDGVAESNDVDGSPEQEPTEPDEPTPRPLGKRK